MAEPTPHSALEAVHQVAAGETLQQEEPINPRDATHYIRRVVVPYVGRMMRIEFDQRILELHGKRISEIGVGSKNKGDSLEQESQIDLSVDQTIRSMLYDHFPQAVYLSEESVDSRYPERQDPRLESLDPEYLMGIENLWIVDPRDGTGRGINGSPRFSVSIALMSKGKVRGAVVHSPITEDTWFADDTQKGAYKNDQRIFVSDERDLTKVNGGIAWPWGDDQRERNDDMFYYLIKKLSQGGLNTASSILDLLEVAEGTSHAFYSYGLKPWDLAGACYIIQKSGGYVSVLPGYPEDDMRDWNPFRDSVLAANSMLHPILREAIRQSMKEAYDQRELLRRAQELEEKDQNGIWIPKSKPIAIFQGTINLAKRLTGK